MDREFSGLNATGEGTENTSEAEKMANVGGGGGVKPNMRTKDREEGTSGQQVGSSAGKEPYRDKFGTPIAVNSPQKFISWI